jgi:5-methyltetrahydropteroyltriglutamate--homocysteine methyltransferase
MAIRTTVVGAFPKPDFLPVIDWFRDVEGADSSNPTENYEHDVEVMGAGAEELFVRAAKSVIDDQVNAGIDVVTDGEVRRENYIHYHCRHLDGIDFGVLTEKDVRGVYSANLPTITAPVRAREPFLPHDWKVAQSLSERPVKVTVPGPMTIGDTVADVFYNDPKKRGAELAQVINKEVLALAEAGCKYIQVDEPLFARRVDDALDFGFDNLEACFHNCPDSVIKTVHMCCGYPNKLDNPEYMKAPQDCYFKLADAIDRSCIQAVSIEDAHRPNDLSLLEMFTNTTVIFGVIAIAKSRVEPTDEIEVRLRQALDHIDPDRLMASPDCGLGFLGRDLAIQKLSNMCEAARRVSA